VTPRRQDDVKVVDGRATATLPALSPVDAASKNLREDPSIALVRWTSPTTGSDASRFWADPEGVETARCTPQFKAATSTHFLWVSWVASPWIPSIWT